MEHKDTIGKGSLDDVTPEEIINECHSRTGSNPCNGCPFHSFCNRFASIGFNARTLNLDAWDDINEHAEL